MHIHVCMFICIYFYKVKLHMGQRCGGLFFVCLFSGIKGIAHSEMLSSFTYPHAVTNSQNCYLQYTDEDILNIIS